MEVFATKDTYSIDSSLCNLSCFECTQLLESTSTIVRRLKRTYCWECWIHHCNFRFRKRLFELARPEKGSRHSDSSFGQHENILIDYNGSTSALALLHLIRAALRAAAGPKSVELGQKNMYLPFKFTILFIHDETGTKSKEELDEELKLLHDWQVSTWLEYGLDFPIIVSSLELSLSILQVYTNADRNERFWRTLSSSPSEVENENTGEEKNSRSSTVFPFTFPFDSILNVRLHFLAQNAKTITSRRDFFQILRENLVVFIGKEINYRKIFVPEEQTAMAIKMFSIMSLGRGAQLAEQMNLTTEIQGLKLARPLMDLALEDLKDYLKCLNCKSKTTTTDTPFPATTATDIKESLISTLHPIAKKGGGGKQSKSKSIETQCKEFIVSLQDGFPSTVPTLTRIGAKLKPSPSLALTQTASLESVPDVNDTEEEDVTERKERKQIMKKKETLGKSESDRSNFSTLTAVCTFCKKNRNDTEDEEALELSLCYGCTNILRDMEEQSYFRELIQPHQL